MERQIILKLHPVSKEIEAKQRNSCTEQAGLSFALQFSRFRSVSMHLNNHLLAGKAEHFRVLLYRMQHYS